MVLSAHLIRVISVKAMTDERTVKKYFNHEPVRNLSALRIEQALESKEVQKAMRAQPAIEKWSPAR